MLKEIKNVSAQFTARKLISWNIGKVTLHRDLSAALSRGGFSQQEEDWRWGNRQSSSSRNKGTLSTSTSQRARGKLGDVVLFLTTGLFGCIVLVAQCSAWGEGSRKKCKLISNFGAISEFYRRALINKTNRFSKMCQRCTMSSWGWRTQCMFMYRFGEGQDTRFETKQQSNSHIHVWGCDNAHVLLCI